ncbi:Putative zinc- or iron-chelating domain protein [Candidatus Gugararchaeum adminiculabundum]|nr:Putative zinc- or iron-chelating domain protein [Candidatus Gugararchaeum adminiculabundum]
MIPLALKGGLQTPCDSCNGKCCKHYAITLSAHDLARLSKTLNMHPREFTRAIEAEKINTKVFPAVINGKYMQLFLAKKENGYCTFFSEETQKCRIHAHRPLACRAYPFTREKFVVKNRKNSICPAKWRAKHVERGKVLHDLVRLEEELKMHDAAVMRVNIRTGGKADLGRFLEELVSSV